MGFLQNLFSSYKSPIGAKEKALMADEKARSAREQADADKLRLKQEEERLALKQSSKAMRGGGRRGLMFRGDQQGVA